MIQAGMYLCGKSAWQIDPVNIIFYKNASATNISSHFLKSFQPSWHQVQVNDHMVAHIDDTAHGGAKGWKLPDISLALGPTLAGVRFHIRVYECYVADDHQGKEPEFGIWSIASVRREHFAFPRWYMVDGWKEPQEYVQEIFTKQPFVGTIYAQDIGNAGWYQGYKFDGSVTWIELLW